MEEECRKAKICDDSLPTFVDQIYNFSLTIVNRLVKISYDNHLSFFSLEIIRYKRFFVLCLILDIKESNKNSKKNHELHY